MLYQITAQDLEYHQRLLAGDISREDFDAYIIDGKKLGVAATQKLRRSLDSWERLRTANPFNMRLLWSCQILPTMMFNALLETDFSASDMCQLPQHLEYKRITRREVFLKSRLVGKTNLGVLEEICDALGVILPWHPQYDIDNNSSARKTPEQAYESLFEQFITNKTAKAIPADDEEPQIVRISDIALALKMVRKGKTVVLEKAGRLVARISPMDESAPTPPATMRKAVARAPRP